MRPALSIDSTFRALGDPTRRRVIEQLCLRPASMTELARPFDMALPSFAKHLGVLEKSGLIRSTKVGRVRTYRLVRSKLASAEHWLIKQRSLWEARLDQLDAHLATMKEEEP